MRCALCGEPIEVDGGKVDPKLGKLCDGCTELPDFSED